LPVGKKVVAKAGPNNPTDTTNSSGLVRGDEAMNATMGAQGTEEASAPRTTAVVPHEQKGVRAPRATAATRFDRYSMTPLHT
jgi:hypothetical protein